MSAHAVQVVRSCGALLDLPVAVTTTALVLTHRCLRAQHNQQSSSSSSASRASSAEPSPTFTALSCLWLAIKTLEVTPPRKLRDVINVAHRLGLFREHDDRDPVDPSLAPPPPPALTVNDEYWALHDRMVRSELLVLRWLRFDVHVELPFVYVARWTSLALDCETSATPLFRRVAQLAWMLVNDMYGHPDTCLDTSPQELAAAAVLYSAEVHCGPPRRDQRESDNRVAWVAAALFDEGKLRAIVERQLARYPPVISPPSTAIEL